MQNSHFLDALSHEAATLKRMTSARLIKSMTALETLEMSGSLWRSSPSRQVLSIEMDRMRQMII